MTRPPASILKAVTAARSGSGKTYVASSATSCGLRKPWTTSTPAIRPDTEAVTSTLSSGRLPRSVLSAPSPASGTGEHSSGGSVVIEMVMSAFLPEV